MSMSEKILADLYTTINHSMRQEYGARANLDILVDDDIGAEMGVSSNLRRGMNNCRWMNSWRIAQRLVKKFERPGKTQIGIFHAQRGHRNHREVLGHDHGCGLGKPRRRRIFGIRDESNFPRPGVLDAVEASNLGVGRAVFEARVKSGRNHRKFHGRWIGCE